MLCLTTFYPTCDPINTMEMSHLKGIMFISVLLNFTQMVLEVRKFWLEINVGP